MFKSTPLTKKQHRTLTEMQNVLRASTPYYKRDGLAGRSDIERLTRAMFIVNNVNYLDSEITDIMREYADADDRVAKIYALGADIRYVLETYIDKIYQLESYGDFRYLTNEFEDIDVKLKDMCVDIEFDFITSKLQGYLNIACTDGELVMGDPVDLSISVPNSVSTLWLRDGLLEDDIDEKVLPKLKWPAGYVPRKLTASVLVDQRSTELAILDVTVTVGEKIKV